ncbi:MAG: hypothetical protein LJE85_00450 [Gammaproteobacteria bacterium]|jgi:hypothetical protein|nr:hypothetical protein [Gammaproteobacteria bacterium]
MFAKQNSTLTLFKATPITVRQQLLGSAGFMFISIVLGLVSIMLLNGGVVNHVLLPVAQYWSLFTVLWNDNPLGALQFLLTKSVISFTHKDPRSGLNLWTYEFDSITIIIYALVSGFGGRLLLKFFTNPRSYRWATVVGLIGCTLVMVSASYMTSIKHCSGATWVGFVSLYGMGFDEFELYPLWQWLCAGLGCLALAGSWLLIIRQPKNTV